METAIASPQLYIPPTARDLSSIITPQIRLGLQGYPGKGKTWSALTFPNPIVLNLDNKLGAHAGRKDVQQIPFYDTQWWLKNYRKGQEERYESVLRWIQEEGPKLSKEQTLFLDSWSALQDWFDMVVGKIKFYTKDGKEDGYKFWNLKGKFAQEICESLKFVNCNVVVAFHEVVERDDEGRISGLKPLMQGSYSDHLPKAFTDWFRQIAQDNPIDKNKTDYLWQVRSDSKVSCLTSKKIPDTLKTVPANYSYFTMQY